MYQIPRRVPRCCLILTLGAVLLSGPQSFGAECSAKGPAPSTLVLTAAHPSARIPLSSRALEGQWSSLEIIVRSIKNPSDATFSILASLETEDEERNQGKAGTASEEIGVLGIYPAGQTGAYRLDAAAALRRLRARGATNKGLRLHLELVGILPRQLPTTLEISLSAPKWLPS